MNGRTDEQTGQRDSPNIMHSKTLSGGEGIIIWKLS